MRLDDDAPFGSARSHLFHLLLTRERLPDPALVAFRGKRVGPLVKESVFRARTGVINLDDAAADRGH